MATTRARYKPWLAVALLALPLLLTGFCRPWGRAQVAPDAVWEQAQALGNRHNLDAKFIYDIAFAESSFNANAATMRARGLMQLTRPAWQRVSDRPFHQAWDWRRNMTAAVAYMDWLRGLLDKKGVFSYPLLAAAYHYGPNRVAENNYDITRLPASENKVYQALLSGRLPDADAVPAPYGTRPDVQEKRQAVPVDEPAQAEAPVVAEEAPEGPAAPVVEPPAPGTQPLPSGEDMPPQQSPEPLETPPQSAQ